jgi:putative peptide zinc metalloprotease protein
MLGPRVAEPAARTLQFLFAPLVLAPLLVASALAHAWLYLVHGVGDAMRDALYVPGRLLVVLPVLLAAAAFHELGHAAALRYGGGRVRGIGAGFYFIFPAFYTDVTDSYRLGRWARVRTDLGGVYFHLLFATGLVALALASGQEALLVAVALIDLEVARQLLPFGRLDGYWTLADLTGVPDFFAQLGPLARGARPPRLRPWARAVFALYVSVTLPVLVVLFLLMLARLPGFVALAWDVSRLHAGAVAEAVRAGDFGALALSAAEVALLGLLALGTGHLLYRTGAGAIGLVWRWSSRTLKRCVAGALATAGAVALVALLWAPRLPTARPPGPADVARFPVTERNHVQTPVIYTQDPPVGGNHAPIWQNCGFYDAPIVAENAVHSLEHGAVWITYRPDLSTDQVDTLRQLAGGNTYVLVSPYPDLTAPAVASAWGLQLQLDSVEDPRLEQFVRAFRLGPQAPESGGPCTGGVGQPR